MVAKSKVKKEKKSVAKIREIEKACGDFRQALIDSDKKMLEKLLSSELTYGHSDGYVEGKTSFIANIASGRYDFVTINTSDQSVSRFGKTAILRHILDADTNDDNNPGHVNLAILLVWRRENCKWRLLARQAVKANA